MHVLCSQRLNVCFVGLRSDSENGKAEKTANLRKRILTRGSFGRRSESKTEKDRKK